jgi:hypothetical protein
MMAVDCLDLQCSLEELKGLVNREIEVEKANRENFKSYRKPGYILVAFIMALFIINLPLFLSYEKYLPVWIISSFAFYMIAWFLVMLPTTAKEPGSPKKKGKEKKSEKGEKKGSGLKENKKTLFNVLWNIFFTNCQPLAPGILLIQIINIILVVYGQFFTDMFNQAVAGVVIFQALMIMAFYGGILFFKPWTTTFLKRMIGMSIESKERWREGRLGVMRVVLFFAAIAVGVALVMIVAILFPGMTLGNFVQALGQDWQTNFLLFVVTLGTQFALIRFLQGIASIELAVGVASHKIDTLENQVLPNIEWMMKGADPSTVAELGDEATDDPIRLKQNYLITKVWTYGKHDFFGVLPVFLVVPNTKLIMDRDFMGAVKGRAVPVA